MQTMTGSEMLTAVTLAGTMGLVGQGIRAVVGLKNAATPGTTTKAADFSAAYLFVSLMIGFIAGVLAGIAMGLENLVKITDMQILLGIAAAGYTGVDFIENMFSHLIPGLGNDPSPPQAAVAPQVAADAGPPPAAAVAQPQPAAAPAIDARLGTLEASFADLRDTLAPAPATLLASNGDVTHKVTVEQVAQMFPATPKANIARHLPSVLAGLQGADLTDKPMVLMALATIRAETEGFVPISEGKSRFNTKDSPFDLYEPGTTVGHNLHNTQPGDGPRFKGRGFVQLTGRSNYTSVSQEIHVDLVASPELANDSAIAGKILAQFLKDHETRIRAALKQNDLATARKLVNGGSHGLVPFEDAYHIGLRVIPA